MMPARRTAPLLVAAALALGACGSGGDGDNGAPPPSPVDPTTLCVDSQCGSSSKLLTIPDAENLLFSADGRLFVSSGLNVFEVVRENDTLVAYALYESTCNFTGLAIRGNVLYANCFDGWLYAGPLEIGGLLQPIHDLGLAAPNGLVDGPDGDLYLVNGPIAIGALPDPKIVRLTLDPDDPYKVLEQSDWYSDGLLGPNGLQRRGRTLYVSNTGAGSLGEIRTIEIAADGTPGASAQLASFISVPDDFSLIGEYVLATWYATGQIALIDPSGAVVASTAPLTFSFPSQARLGQPPLFAPDDILVTEKGIIGDTGSNVGNALSVFRRNPAR